MPDSPFRIMMVDDVVRHQRLYESTITDAVPSTVEFAVDGEEALQKIDPCNPPDLLILDLNMPRLGGEEVLRFLRREPAFDRMPVIILTGETDAACHHRLLELGADDFVEKGCTPEIFIARLNNQIRHKQTLDRFTQMAVDMDMFAAGVLHDIRNLEAVIVAVCHLAIELMNEDPLRHRDQVLNDLTSLENRARKLGLYARDIIQMVRETQKKLELAPQSIEDGLQWCREVLSYGDRLIVRIPDPLVPVMADAQFLRLALLNIIANTLKYAREGTPPALDITQEVSTSETVGGARVITRLRDHGSGIAESDLRRVFEPFSRGKGKGGMKSSGSATGAKEGFGLGLAMVAKVISSMGGRVWAELPGDGAPGTVICLELPAPSEGC